MIQGKRRSLTFIGDDGLPEGNLKWNIDFDNPKSPQKEMFIDFNECRDEFLLYVIDHSKKVFVPYTNKYLVNLLNTISDICNKFDIKGIGMYGIRGRMCSLYNNLIMSQYDVYDRNDIYQWRRSLDIRTRKITHPIYYYESQGYLPMSEKDYMIKL